MISEPLISKIKSLRNISQKVINENLSIHEIQILTNFYKSDIEQILYFIRNNDNKFIRLHCDCGAKIKLVSLKKAKLRNKIPYCCISCANKSTEAKEKSKKTIQEKYGVDSPMQSKMIRNNHRKSMLEKYGVESPLQSEEIKRKSIETWNTNKENKIEKKLKNQFPYIDRNVTKFIQQTYNIDNPLPIKDKEELFQISGYKTRDGFRHFLNIRKIPYEVAGKCSSSYELEISSHLQKKDIDIKQNDKLTLNGLELDIYIPEKKLAIEFNGDYWHSVEKKSIDYHLNKTNLCESKGIRLIHIWESEWLNDRKYIKYILDCYLNNKIPNYKCYDKLSRDYFQVLDFPNKEIISPTLTKSGEHNVYKTGYIKL